MTSLSRCRTIIFAVVLNVISMRHCGVYCRRTTRTDIISSPDDDAVDLLRLNLESAESATKAIVLRVEKLTEDEFRILPYIRERRHTLSGLSGSKSAGGLRDDVKMAADVPDDAPVLTVSNSSREGINIANRISYNFRERAAAAAENGKKNQSPLHNLPRQQESRLPQESNVGHNPRLSTG